MVFKIQNDALKDQNKENRDSIQRVKASSNAWNKQNIGFNVWYKLIFSLKHTSEKVTNVTKGFQHWTECYNVSFNDKAMSHFLSNILLDVTIFLFSFNIQQNVEGCNI